ATTTSTIPVSAAKDLSDVDMTLAQALDRSSKTKSFANVQELFDKGMKRVNTFVDMDTELMKGNDGDDSTIEATHLSTKSLTIIDYKIYKEGKKSYFQIIRADGNSQMYLTFGKMLKNFDREDLEVLWSIVKARFKKTELVNYMDIFLHLNLKTIVHCATMQNILYYLLVEKMYPLTKHTLRQMFNDVKLQVDYECEIAFKLLRLLVLLVQKLLLFVLKVNVAEYEPTGSITTWDGLKTKFLNKYCPPARTAKKMEEINNFQQEPDENLYQAWEQFKELLMKCPQHYLTEMQETVADAKVAIQEMDEYSQKWHNGTSRSRSTETSNGLAAIQAQLNNLGREIKKVNEKVYAAQVGCEQCKGPHYTKDCPLKEEGKTLKEAYYTQFGGPFQGGGYRAAAPGFYQRNNANPSYQERRQSMEDTLSKFMSESAKRHEENSNLIKEIRASTDAAIRNQGASIKTLEIQIGQMSKVLQERGFGSLPSSTEANPRDQVKSISTTIEADSYPIRHIGSSQYAVSTGQNRTLMYETRQMTILFPSPSQSIPQKEKDPGSFTLPCFINNVCFDNALVDLGASVSVMPLSTYLNLGLGELAHTKLTVELADKTMKYPKGIAENVLVGIGKFTFLIDFIILEMPEDIKVPLILERPFLSTAYAKIDFYKRKITLRVGEERIVFTSVKPACSLIKKVYMLSLRERMELDLEARLMGETLVLNRSLDPFFEDYIELNDLHELFELRRNQG
ncbi:DNA-directed DNA polymerase, partial [Tanacetum coccineum]